MTRYFQQTSRPVGEESRRSSSPDELSFPAFQTAATLPSLRSHQRTSTSPRRRRQTACASLTVSTDLHVERFDSSAGASAPEAVFVHDFMTDARLFSRILDPSSVLHTRASCTSFDMRGFGRSPDPVGPYSRIADISNARGRKDPCHLVGCGMGGVVAMEYALERPEDVLSVSLVSSGLPGHAWRRRNALFRLPSVEEVVEEEGGFAREIAREWIRESSEWRTAIEKGGDVAVLLREMYRDYGCFHFREDDEVVPNPCDGSPLSERISGLSVPVLALVGEEEADEDCVDFVRIGHEILESVPNPAFGLKKPYVLKEAGHFGAFEAAGECAELLSKLWDDVQTVGAA